LGQRSIKKGAEMEKICDYGCGQKATHQFANGKWILGDVLTVYSMSYPSTLRI